MQPNIKKEKRYDKNEKRRKIEDEIDILVMGYLDKTAIPPAGNSAGWKQ